MSEKHGDKKREIEAEQAYLDWAVGQLDAELHRLEHGALMDGGAVDRQIRALRESKAHELRAARDALLIGRLDVVSSSEVAGTWYIGRTDVADESYETVVVDWRSNLGARFYEAGRRDPMEVGRRRTFGTSGNTITSIDDEILTSGFALPGAEDPAAAKPTGSRRPSGSKRRERPAEQRKGSAKQPLEGDRDRDTPNPKPVPGPGRSEDDLIGDLRAQDLLLAELERGRTAEMHEIVTTIQADQDRFIRTDPSQPLVVQGGPGTGKTVVGLHRAAYLLYRQRQGGTLRQSMLIVGPNSAFMDYIGAVLPSLGETASRQMALDDLMVSALRAPDRKGLGARTAADSDEAARLKGSPVMAVVAARAVWAHAEPTGVEASFRGMRAALGVAEVTALLERAGHGRSYDDVRSTIEKQLAAELTRKLRTDAEALDRKLFSQDVESFNRSAEAQLRSEEVRDSVMPKVSVSAVLAQVLGDPGFLDDVAGDLLTEQERRAICPSRPVVSKGAVVSRGKRRDLTPADLALIDELAGIIGSDVTKFDHVIVDEAQDLSPMQWRAILRRTRAGGITVLGDLAQATGVWSPDSWRQLLDHLGFEGRGQVGELRLGYRVPKPILEYASRLLSVAAPDVVQPVSYRDGLEPQLHRVAEHELWDAALSLVGEADGRTAVIAAPNVVVPLAGRTADGDTITILSPDESKGLEFDQVIVIEPSTLATLDRRGFRQMYVALTRSTKRLDIVHSQDLPSLLEGQIPGLAAPATDEPAVDHTSAWAVATSLDGVALLGAPDDRAVAPAANWFSDPTERFSNRYWDGEQWTGWVTSASGAVAADPVPVGPVDGPTSDPSAAKPHGLPLGTIDE